jgi:hypothetical protein
MTGRHEDNEKWVEQFETVDANQFGEGVVPKDARSGWIEPWDAVNRISHFVGGDAVAKRMLADRVRDSQLELSAGCLTEGADLGAISSTIPKLSDVKFGTNFAWQISCIPGKRLQIASGFWSSSVDWEKDLKRWRWGDGIFVVSSPPLSANNPNAYIPLRHGLPRRLVAYGVSFNLSEIEALLPAAVQVGPPPVTSTAKVKLVRVRKWDWEPILIDLIAHVEGQGLENVFRLREQKGQARLEEWMRNRFIDKLDDAPSSSEVRRRATAIIDALVRRSDGG